MRNIRQVAISNLVVGYEEYGPPNGVAVLLLHGFPYSPRAFDDVFPFLTQNGFRVILPYLRGFAPTRFVNETVFRSGEQAALGHDLIELIVALDLDKPIVAGFDWGGRAACVAAAIRPDLVRGLVSCGGYNIFGPAVSAPLPPEVEHVLWYQYYLHTDRGRTMLETNRTGFCNLLWKLWSPRWNFESSTFSASAQSFDGQDFVEVVLHSYRHRAGLVSGDPVLAGLAVQLEHVQPVITVPTIALFSGAGPLPSNMEFKRDRFVGPWKGRAVPDAGHNVPQEAPDAFASAVLDVSKMS